MVLDIQEVILVAGASFLYGKDLVVSSKWYGKISTVLFYVAIFCSMLIKQFQLPYTFDNYIYYIAIGLTVFSLVMYWKAFYVKDFLKKEK